MQSFVPRICLQSSVAVIILPFSGSSPDIMTLGSPHSLRVLTLVSSSIKSSTSIGLPESCLSQLSVLLFPFTLKILKFKVKIFYILRTGYGFLR